MLQRTGWGASRRGRAATKVSRSLRLGFDPLEGRALMAASLAPISNITAPAGLGYQVPLNGSATTAASQSFTASSSNPDVKVSVATGNFLTVGINHVSGGATDPAFTGTLTFQLFSDDAPTAVAAIERLVASGFYTNANTISNFNNANQIFRVASGFPDNGGSIAQFGAVNVSTQGGTDTPPAPGTTGGLPATGFPFQNELTQSLAFTNPGQLALANAGYSQSDVNPSDFFTNSSQLFITNGAPRSLDFGYTILGQLVAQSSPNLLNELMSVQVKQNAGGENSSPVGATTVVGTTLSTTSPNGVLHIDTTRATAGETSTVTATAFDVSTNTTSAQSFTVTVGPTNAFPGPAEKPLLTTFPSVSAPIATAVNQPAIFQIQGISPGSPTDALTYSVFGTPASGSTLTLGTVQNGTATVSSNGLVTVTPNQGYTGPISFLVGVRDQTDRTGKGLNDPSNYDLKQYTVQVSGTTPVSRAPIAQPVTVAAAPGTATTVQLQGVSGTTGTGANLTYAIVTNPAHGTITNFNPTTGSLTYTPTSGFTGSDTFTYTTTDTTNNLTSTPGTVTVNVATPTAVTGAVREISDGTTLGDNILVITPPPNKKRQQDQIAVLETTPAGSTSPVIQVMVNGVIDSTQPTASSITGIVIYGSKTGTSVLVAPNITVPVSGDTGHGGRNFYNDAGSADAEIRAWFGHSTVQGGSGTNAIVGQRGHFKVVKSPGTDSVFVSKVNPYARVPHYRVAGAHVGSPPLGSFYKFVGNKLVKTGQPVNTRLDQNKTTG